MDEPIRGDSFDDNWLVIAGLIGKGRRLGRVMVAGVACRVFDVGADGRPDAVGVTRPTSDVARPLRGQPSVKADGYSGIADVSPTIQDHLARALHKVLKNNSDQ
ncbi:hypothetical protein [Streptomyces capitiformicae]|uniref:Uncharacterized protein n=1 Tax=Streptomyces capitiformicae TaxID=2014920 RepID=A0A919GBW3_9ACTN|nr:hypothetical protein [Streptomyces capitiformicae]GHH81378.1 hypothetical protein GCM10017771_03140 [Streptomyces capitiformicae]